jgi:class 3 adenylate cyclase
MTEQELAELAEVEPAFVRRVVRAGVLGRLAALIDSISRGYAGRPVRWLGDGGMFVFREPADAVRAALEMVAQAPGAGLPPTHIGIHSGPVAFQDGDVYGTTVNIAARLSASRPSPRRQRECRRTRWIGCWFQRRIPRHRRHSFHFDR